MVVEHHMVTVQYVYTTYKTCTIVFSCFVERTYSMLLIAENQKLSVVCEGFNNII